MNHFYLNTPELFSCLETDESSVTFLRSLFFTYSPHDPSYKARRPVDMSFKAP